MSQNTVPTFVFWISRLPRGLEIPSWAIFNSSLFLDFENIQVFIIWLNLDWDIGKILLGGNFKKFTFFVNYLINHISTHELSWRLLSVHEHSGALMSSHEYSAIAPWVRPGRYTENHKPKVNISRFLEKNRTEEKID